jgi:ComF family protein
VYEGVLRESVLKLKHEPYLSTKLFDLLIETARRPPLDLSTRVMPVPLHPRRRKARGFNQASVIATRVARALRLPFDGVSLVRTGLFERYRAGLDARGRHETVRGVFEVRLPGTVKAEDILLVDDVFTTGSTVSNCAEALLSAGARNVYVLTVARPAY